MTSWVPDNRHKYLRLWPNWRSCRKGALNANCLMRKLERALPPLITFLVCLLYFNPLVILDLPRQ